MATAVQTPAGPVQKAMGLGMQKLQMKKRSKDKELRAQGLMQPSTIVNLNPFPLKVEAGALVTAVVPARKPGEKFAYVTISEPRYAFPFKGVLSANNGTELVNDYDVLPVLPIQQAMDFYKSYMETTQDMSGGVMGGVLIFQGEIDVLDKLKVKDFEVRVPYLEIMEDGTSFVATKTAKLADLWNEAANSLKVHCLAKIQQATSFQADPTQVKNIVSDHRMYAKFAMQEGWITAPPSWLNFSPSPDSLCKKCGTQLRPEAYMCGKCGKIYNVLEAYKECDVEFGHVSFQMLDEAGWKEVKRIKAQRDKMAGIKE